MLENPQMFCNFLGGPMGPIPPIPKEHFGLSKIYQYFWQRAIKGGILHYWTSLFGNSVWQLVKTMEYKTGTDNWLATFRMVSQFVFVIPIRIVLLPIYELVH